MKGRGGALENGSIRSLMKGNVLLTVSRVIWSVSMSLFFPFLSLYIIELGGTKPIVGKVNALGQGLGVGIGGGGYTRGFIPSTIGAFLGGYIYEFNPAMPWLIQAVLLLLGIALTVLFVKEPEKAEI